MRLLIKSVLAFLVAFLSFYIVYDTTGKGEAPKIPYEIIGSAETNEYYVYGKRLNIKGSINLNYSFNEVNLLLYDEKEIKVPLCYEFNDGVLNFYISDKINGGYDLENLDIGNYYVLLEVVCDNEVKYYNLKNNTSYDGVNYYTLSKTNHKVTFTTNYYYDTLYIKVTSSKSDDAYDVIIDPGHGGKDTGAYNSGHSEKAINLDVALKLGEYLKKNNVKVTYTRKKDVYLTNYSVDGSPSRLSIINNSHAKYIIALHLNSTTSKKAKGVEVYTNPNINYDFAKSIADNIVKDTGTIYSPNMTSKMYNGVYTRLLTKKHLENNIEEAKEKGIEPYDIKENTAYYFMIREPGGIVTHAYVDGRDKEVGVNSNYNGNIGIEGYLIEMGYLTNSDDYNNLVNNSKKYAEAIGNAIIKELGY